MQFLHDVWVNWFEGEENGYNICFFHEWRKDDGIELLDQVPLLYIESDLYNYILDNISEIPEDMLDYIHRKAYTRKGKERSRMEYAAIITDGNDILVFDTIGHHIPIRKSRIIPRQEQIVYEMIEHMDKVQFEFKKSKKEYHILSLDPKYMCGLTRTERRLKEILMMALDSIKGRNDLHEMKYWLTEIKPDVDWLNNNNNMSNDEAFSSLFELLVNGWSEAHEEVCRRIVKGQPFFEKLWEIESKYINNKDKLVR